MSTGAEVVIETVSGQVVVAAHLAVGMSPISKGKVIAMTVEQLRASLGSVALILAEVQSSLQSKVYQTGEVSVGLELRGDGNFKIVEFGTTGSIQVKVMWQG